MRHAGPKRELTMRLGRLGGQAVRDFVRAQIALLRTAANLRSFPVGSLTVESAKDASREDVTPADKATSRTGHRVQDPAARAAQVSRAITRAARFGLFRPSCLVRAMALRELLDANGLDGSTVHVGVWRDADEFAAHAWVQYGDRVLGETKSRVGRFRRLGHLTVQ